MNPLPGMGSYTMEKRRWVNFIMSMYCIGSSSLGIYRNGASRRRFGYRSIKGPNIFPHFQCTPFCPSLRTPFCGTFSQCDAPWHLIPKRTGICYGIFHCIPDISRPISQSITIYSMNSRDHPVGTYQLVPPKNVSLNHAKSWCWSRRNHTPCGSFFVFAGPWNLLKTSESSWSGPWSDCSCQGAYTGRFDRCHHVWGQSFRQKVRIGPLN
jgi:hypothetical protein